MLVSPVNAYNSYAQKQPNFTAAKTIILRDFNSPRFGMFHLRKMVPSATTPRDVLSRLYLTQERKLFGIIPLPDKVISIKTRYISKDTLNKEFPNRPALSCKHFRQSPDNPNVTTVRSYYETRTMKDIEDTGFVKADEVRRESTSPYIPIEADSWWW